MRIPLDPDARHGNLLLYLRNGSRLAAKESGKFVNRTANTSYMQLTRRISISQSAL